MDAAYYIVRELMNTERTYKKDLEVIAVVSYMCDICINCVIIYEIFRIWTVIFTDNLLTILMFFQ